MRSLLVIRKILNVVSFPGVVVHEVVHRFICDLIKVPVYDICYFKFGNTAGYVIHGDTKGLRNSFLVSVGPLIVNSILCILLTSPFVFPMYVLPADQISPIFVVLLWLGLSIGMHAFPSEQDMSNFLTDVKKTKRRGLLYLVALPSSLIVRIASRLRCVFFDLIYVFFIGFVLPSLLLG